MSAAGAAALWRPGRIRALGAFLRFLFASVVAGGIGALVTLPAIPNWYALIVKPGWTPPDAVFGPAWTTLYLAMSVAAWLVWREGPQRPRSRTALSLFWLQLLLNGLWSPLFFGLRRPAWGLIDILALDLAVAVTIVLFFRLNRFAGVLFAPYLVWLCYATALNAAIWRLNG